jgi:hypothetical protein
MSLASEQETDKEKEKGVLSADDEGYETPGKKELYPLPVKSCAKSEHTLKRGGSGDNATACEDDGYETGGKKNLTVKAKANTTKESRKRGGGASPRPEHHSTRSRDDSRVDQLIAEMEGLTTKDQLKDSAIELLRLVPDGYIPLPHQVGGHRHIDGKLGFLRRKNQPHLLYKPVSPCSKGIREVTFYESVYKHTSHLKDDTLFPSLSDPSCTPPIPLSFLPMYYGTTAIDDKAGHQTNYLILEDITHRFTHPCIIDIKMGTRVHADQANIAGERRKFLIQELFGFRIAGMRVYNHVKEEYVYYDRHYGLSITDANAPSSEWVFVMWTVLVWE